MWVGHLWKQCQPVLQPPATWRLCLKCRVDWAAEGHSVNFWGWGTCKTIRDGSTTMSHRWLLHQVGNTQPAGQGLASQNPIPPFLSQRSRARPGVAAGVNWESRTLGITWWWGRSKEVGKAGSDLVAAVRVLLSPVTTRQVPQWGGNLGSQPMGQGPVQQSAWPGVAVMDLETGTPTA